MENKIPWLLTVWEHSLTCLLGNDCTTEAGMALRHWVHFQWVHFSWGPEEIKADPTQTAYHQDDQGQYLYLRTNQVKQICGLITYTKLISESYHSDPDLPDDPLHPFTPDEWAQYTPTQMRTYLIQPHFLSS